MCQRLFWLLCVYVLAIPGLAQDPIASATSSWYRGQGTQFEILISGQVTEDGKRPSADSDIELQLTRNDEQFWSQVIHTQSGRYQCWVPVGAHPRWYSIVVSGRSAAGAAGRAFATAGKLQKAIRDGLDLNLAKPTRTLTVKVTHQGQPVPQARVHFSANQGDETLETDANGIAHPQVCGDTPFIELFAWTNSKMISPKIYRRSGTAGFDSNEFELELFPCKSTNFLVKDQQGNAAPHVPLIIVSDRHLANAEEQSFYAPPDVSFVSDADGKIVNAWLPDLADLKINYGLRTKDWSEESIDTSTTPITLTVKPAKQRVRMEGQVVAEPGVEVAGLFVKLSSFQAEQEGLIEAASAIVDSAGHFTVDVLPGVTYAACINDYSIVSEFQKVVVDPTASTQPTLNLKAVQGVPVVVQVTQGDSSQPQAGVRAFVYSDFDLTWVENGRQNGGTLNRNSDGFTNELGQVTLYTLPGKTKVSVMYGDWAADSRHEVKAGDSQPVQFNRKLQGKIRGRVIADESSVKGLAGTKVIVVSVDNRTPETHRLTTDEKGAFDFESSATAVWALAMTANDELMGSEKLSDVNQELVIRLGPTNHITGRLLDANNQPIANREVETQIVIENHPHNNLILTKVFQRSTGTDKDGRYTFAKLPCKVPIGIVVFQSATGVKQSDLVERVFFRDANDKRTELKSVLSDTASRTSTTFAQRYESLLKDCRLNNYRLLVVIANKSDVNEKFLNTRLLDDGELAVMSAYMPLWLTDKELSDPATQVFSQKLRWPAASDQHVFVSVVDGSGRELGRITGDARDANDSERIISLVKAHAPVPSDAQAAWQAAFAEAKSSHRRVWARVGGRYCGHCFRLTEWIDKHKAVLEKEFVLFKVDTSNDLNSQPVTKQIMQGKSSGVPFHAIFSADGQMLTDSEGPFGNIGSIGSSLESLRHFRHMLQTGCVYLSQAEIDVLVKSLE